MFPGGLFSHAAIERARRELILRELLEEIMIGDHAEEDEYYGIDDVDDEDEDDGDEADPLQNPLHHVIDSVSLDQKAGRDICMPDIEWDSDEGRRMKEESEELKNRGNAALKNKNYELAICFYTDAVVVAYRLTNNKELVGTLLSNRSSVYCLVNKFPEALDDAKKCIFCRPSWIKGALRLMRAHVGLKDFQEAFSVGIAASRHYKCSKEEMLEIFIETLQLLPNVPDYSDLNKLKVKDEGWKVFLQKLSQRKTWQPISVLFQGRAGSDPILTSYRATDLDLSGLLENCSVAEWKSWGQRLAVKLLHTGAKMVSLDPDKKHGAHSAFRMCMKTGVYELLRHLFLHYIPTGDRDRMDDEGSTLLHLACRNTFPTKLAAVKLLLEHTLSPLCKNKQQQRPLDLLPITDPDRADIIEAVANKGFEVPTLTTNATKVTATCNDNGSSDFSAISFNPLTSSVPGPSSEILKWSTRDVEHWLTQNKLLDIKERMRGVDGRGLMELKHSQETAPTTFYQLLHSTLGLSLVQLLSVASAVRNLPTETQIT